MNKIILFITILFVSCNQNPPVKDEINPVDSIISVSEKNIKESNKTMIKTDSIISNKLKQLDKNGGK